jgi:hypothetical protein
METKMVVLKVGEHGYMLYLKNKYAFKINTKDVFPYLIFRPGERRTVEDFLKIGARVVKFAELPKNIRYCITAALSLLSEDNFTKQERATKNPNRK